MLDSHELPFEIVDGKLVKKHRTPPVQWIYPLIFSDMSIGALSTRAWEAAEAITDEAKREKAENKAKEQIGQWLGNEPNEPITPEQIARLRSAD